MNGQKQRFTGVLIIMLGALSALAMLAISARALLMLGDRIQAQPMPSGTRDLAIPALIVAIVVVVPGLLQGMFVGYLSREREVYLAVYSSLVTMLLATICTSAMLRGVEFGSEINGSTLRLAMTGLVLLAGAMFVLSAALGGRIAARAQQCARAGTPPSTPSPSATDNSDLSPHGKT